MKKNYPEKSNNHPYNIGNNVEYGNNSNYSSSQNYQSKQSNKTAKFAAGNGNIPQKAKKKKSKKNRAMIIVLDLLIVACIVAFAYLVGIRYYNNYMNDKKTMQLLINQAEGKLDEKTGKAGIWIDPKANPVSGEGGYDTPDGLVDSSQSKHDGPVFVEMIGQMTIDKINLNMPVVWGCDYPQLQVGLGWYQKSAELGHEGNSVILGHRMLEYGRHFNRLNEMQEGDIVRISTKNNNYTYKVKNQIIVSVPEMFNYFENHDNKSELTLVTCTNQGDTRILVQCELEKSSSSKN